MQGSEDQKAARVMHEDYNNTVAGWVGASIDKTLPDLIKCVDLLHEKNP